jgi:DNA-binding transcriptional ArsR family regulator
MVSAESRTGPLLRRLDPTVAPARLALDSGGGYEALVALIRFAGHEPPGEYDVGHEWSDRVQDAASPQLRAAVDRLCGGVPTVFGHLLGLVRQCNPPRDLASLIDLVETLPPYRLRLELLGSSASSVQAGVPPAVLERAAEGDAAAVQELLAAAAGDRRWTRNLHAVLDLTPQRTAELTLEILRRWADEVFAEQEPALVARLAAQERRWRADIERVSWRELVENVTGGIVLEDDQLAERVLLVPTVLGAPWVYATDVRGTKIFCCPVREDLPAAGPELVRLLRALADDTRLNILRRVAEAGSATLSELTASLGMSKSAVHKHLVLLRSAGLLRVSLGQDRRYVLRDLPDLNALVTAAIRGGP